MIRFISMISAVASLAFVMTGCTSTEQALTPMAGLSSGVQPQFAAAPDTADNVAGSDSDTMTALAPQAQEIASLPAGQRVGSIRFTPVIGAPVSAVTPLSKMLGSEARQRGLEIKSANDTSSDNILKGYFSALNDSDNTTVIYVWDILDNAGNRLHRIQGQQRIPGSSSDPWASVPTSVMERIASQTMSEYMAWRSKRRG